jgi:AraC-like DNA-binding protein/mannose-6-phosphate isomerase-like protein (cupin superfamily)
MSSFIRTVHKPYTFEKMLSNPHAIERLDIAFHWGGYGVRMLKFHHIRFSAGKIIPFHKHSDYEFHYIPRGKGKVILGNEQFALTEGMMYLTGPGVFHYQEADEFEAMDELCLHIDIETLSRETPQDDNRHWGVHLEYADAEACIQQLIQLPPRPIMDKFHAMDCFMDAYQAWLDNQSGLFTIIQQNIIQILLRTCRAYQKSPSIEVPSRDMRMYRYQLVVQFIKDNYASALTLDMVAERAQISTRQLQRLFREQLGISFSDYVENIRLAHVCEELTINDLPIEQIALGNGFSSANYLHHVFKKKFGTTPFQFRKQHQMP